MSRSFFPILLIPIFISVSCAPTDSFSNWTPSYIRYCELLSSTNTSAPNVGGVACGATAYNIMSYLKPVEIASTSTLGLINVGWMTYEALQTERQFWKACKSYMVRIFDGLFEDATKSCAYSVNTPTGIPTCTNTAGNLIYRTGSGYCMKEKICGASIPITFLANADNSSVVYSWETSTTSMYTSAGYFAVGKCYGYKLVANTAKSSDTITTADEFY